MVISPGVMQFGMTGIFLSMQYSTTCRPMPGMMINCAPWSMAALA